MNQPAANPASSPATPDTVAPLPDTFNAGMQQPVNIQAVDIPLRDIHLPEPISWWPPAPGWWLTLAAIIMLIVIFFVARKIYRSQQLNRDISSELQNIRQQYQQNGNKPQLARDLSILLRRANISYYPKSNIAGLTGEQWLQHLDRTNDRPRADLTFQSETGHMLTSAPYLPDDAELDFDADKLISLCESWLTSRHSKTQVAAR